jgi:hypothetical protein
VKKSKLTASHNYQRGWDISPTGNKNIPRDYNQTDHEQNGISKRKHKSSVRLKTIGKRTALDKTIFFAEH